MKPLQKLIKAVRTSFPDAKCELDAAEHPNGSSFLDIHLGDYWLVADWRKQRGFGLTARTNVVYGEGADEVIRGVDSAVARVLWLLEHKAATCPPLPVQLRDLRSKRHLTQVEIAQRLGVMQSSVSKLESRGENISLRKLQELIAAMGGELSLHITFPAENYVDELVLLKRPAKADQQAKPRIRQSALC
ncbi:MAG TPA: XRE family transcriptional regulator [Gemmataceae bacterium]|nr:XRE family transcriptional regulator [Gemmataceae bacterium]